MRIITRQVRALLLLAAMLVVATFATNVFAQNTQMDTAYVPFVVNVDATIMVAPKDGDTLVQIAVIGGEETVVGLPILQSVGVAYFGTQRQANTSAIISNRAGKISVSLPVQSYKNAEVALYTVNGKRILRRNVSATSAANNITRSDLTTGMYLLSIRGTDGNALTSRITHSGGNFDINVAFGNVGENTSSIQRLAKKAEDAYWTIAVSSSVAGYVDSMYVLRPVGGINPRQNITLRETSVDEYAVIVSSVGTGYSGGSSYAAGVTVSISAGTAPTGQRFKEWTTSSSDVIFVDKNSAATTFIMPANAVTVTAVFEAQTVVPTTYSITYILNGGTVVGTANPTSYTAETATITLNNPTQTGYTFTGWTGSNGTTAKTTVTIAQGSTGDKSYIANWEATIYLITYTLNGGTVIGTANPSSYTIETPTITLTNPINTGYTFTGWTGSNGTIHQTTVSVAQGSTGDKSYTANWQQTSGGGGSYESVKIGNQTWMKKNLDIETEGSWCYEDSENNCAQYGRLYTWEAARTACPRGWHLPSYLEWDELLNFAGGWEVAGKKLKSKNGWKNFGLMNSWENGNGTDNYGFSALPGGLQFDGFYEVGNRGHWWTADNRVNDAYSRHMSSTGDAVEGYYSDNSRGLSVRCVADN
jgi:uncharacterized protein (TIGR02145 family)/uncharacterized repeat protein (TIGR02543 family)